jgi:hypothetical protein
MSDVEALDTAVQRGPQLLASDAQLDSIRCMARTTLDLDDGVLTELKRRRDRERRPMGAIASELLVQAFASTRSEVPATSSWTARPLGARVDIEDKEALWAVLDRS